MTTIVTAFLTNINNNRPIDVYLSHGKKILRQDVPCVCFIEKEVYDKHIDPSLYPQTHFVMVNKHDIYLYNYTDKITDFHVYGNSQKDTLDYMILNCYKTEFVRRAILLDKFKTSNYAWVDFGVGHMMSDVELSKGIIHVSKTTYTNLRIGNADNIPLDKSFNIDLYRNVVFYFLGSVFGGHKNTLIEFADRMKTKCIDIIQSRNHLMWEVNIWYLIYKENSVMFNPYPANHDYRILHNY
jgi:hypothetical protein